MIHKSALGKALGREALLFNVETAVAEYQQGQCTRDRGIAN